MKPEDFVRALKHECRDAAVLGCVENCRHPPGRKPGEELVAISKWFNALPEADRELVVGAMRHTADATLFGVLCVLDGVRTVEPAGEKTEFNLCAIKAGIESRISPNETYLHDLLRAES
jgi:hypothetical protein